ncbi:MAG: UDP-glucose/GDP-mannose dehydrogenase family protein [Candidatus Terrybacteria bacterium]|nr:UDP-glucose/GDP-mannose dehydrogenase family protein [Candidatus Terrybacteria bacterium]
MPKNLNIGVIGTGYVGLVTGICLADKGFNVICVDNNKEKIDKLKNGELPIYEPGLNELLHKNSNRITFTTDLLEAVEKSNIIFLAVGTPSKESGEVDLSYLYQAVDDIGKYINHPTIIVTRSTVPPGTTRKLKDIINKYPNKKFEVVSNPEFLSQNSAIKDFMNPYRIVVGTDSEAAKEIMDFLYKDFDCPKIFTGLENAEMIKYASNAFLATKISYISEISKICDKIGADVFEVVKGMTLDPRIGDKYWRIGIGFGGSCLPKDTLGLYHIAEANDCHPYLLKAVTDVNNYQRTTYFFQKIKSKLGEIKGKNVTVWGLTFKQETDDLRESQAVELIKFLKKEGVETIKICDPLIKDFMKDYFSEYNDDGSIEFYIDPYESVKGSDAIIISNRWSGFSKTDKKRIKELMRDYYVIDGKNILDPKEMKELGFYYEGIGRR